MGDVVAELQSDAFCLGDFLDDLLAYVYLLLLYVCLQMSKLAVKVVIEVLLQYLCMLSRLWTGWSFLL